MVLLNITPIVVLIIQLYGLSQAADLHKLANNRLDVGSDRELPNATPIHCGMGTPRKVTTTTYRNPGQALTTSIFGSTAFTSGAIGAQNGPSPGVTKYKFAEFHGDKVLYALEVDSSGEMAQWLPQGSTIDIHQHPHETQPHYVFTPDFSGCSWTVTPNSHNGMHRLHHVEGGREDEQFNNLSEAQKGGPVTYAMQYKDYGYIVETRRLVSNVPAYAYMHYSGGKWNLYVQRKSCTPETGGYTFNDHRVLTGLVMNEAKQTTYPPISGTKHYTVPT